MLIIRFGILASILLADICFSNAEFTVTDPFFNRAAHSAKKELREIKPKQCPDGSEFVVLDFGSTEINRETDIASCLYFDKKNTLTIEHEWIGNTKIREYSTINDIRSGPMIEKPENGSFYLAHEICEGKIIRTEVVTNFGFVSQILLYINSSETKSPDVIVDFLDASKSRNLNLISDFKPCDYKKFKIKNPGFKKWLGRKWYPLKQIND